MVHLGIVQAFGAKASNRQAHRNATYVYRLAQGTLMAAPEFNSNSVSIVAEKQALTVQVARHCA